MIPRLGLVLGDPAGIGPEIMARLLAEPANREKAALLLVADPEELAEGMRIAGVDLPVTRVNDPAALAPGRIALHELRRDAPVPRGTSSAEGGRHALATLRECLALAQAGSTCAHGTGFDIQGKGIARVGALQAAFDLACAMGARRRARG